MRNYEELNGNRCVESAITMGYLMKEYHAYHMECSPTPNAAKGLVSVQELCDKCKQPLG